MTSSQRIRIGSQGRITIPVAMRRRLGLAPGDALEFYEAASGGTKVRLINKPATAIVGLMAHWVREPSGADAEMTVDGCGEMGETAPAVREGDESPPRER